jgi:hypothetical protein
MRAVTGWHFPDELLCQIFKFSKLNVSGMRVSPQLCLLKTVPNEEEGKNRDVVA